MNSDISSPSTGNKVQKNKKSFLSLFLQMKPKSSKISSLPADIITEILIRLPVKSLLRFRCVSKSWCSQIDGPDFINLHLTHSIISSSNLSPFVTSESTIYFLDSDSLENFVKIEFPPITVFNTCNGLLLLGNLWNFPYMIISNPATRKYLVLPNPPETNYPDLISIEICRLGYDVVNDDYKVFDVLKLIDRTDKSITWEARIYSLKSNSWHVVKDFTKGMLSNFDFQAYVNGALHTVNDTDFTTIFALDVCKEAINLLPLPNTADKNVLFSMAHVFEGCLAFLCLYPDNRTDIWVMREYGVKESWSMLLSVKPGNYGRTAKPMVYSKSRTEVLLSYYCQKLVWYDLRKKTFRGLPVEDLPIGFYRVCVESLVSIGYTQKIDDKKKQHEKEKMKVEIVKKKRSKFHSILKLPWS